MDLQENNSNAAAIIQAVTALNVVQPGIVLDNGSELYFHPDGMTPYTVPALNPILPARVSQAETVVDPKSFTDYINRFKSPTAICKASLSRTSLEAVLDYHGPAVADGAAVTGALTHRITLNCPYDVDYAAWKKRFNEAMPQSDYVEFIEDMTHTIAEPAAADLIAALRTIGIDRAVKFKSVLNTTNGTMKVAFEEEDKPNGEIVLPTEIVLALPVFQGTPAIAIPAKLRYRLTAGVLKFVVAVPGIAKLERDEFFKVGAGVETATSLPVYFTA